MTQRPIRLLRRPEEGGPSAPEAPTTDDGPAGPLASDAVSEVLRAVRLDGAVFFLWEASAPFAMPVPAGRTFAPAILRGATEVVSYHLVTEGTAWASLGGESPPVRVGPGEVLFVPRGDAYVMASAPEACLVVSADLEGSLEFFGSMAAGELPFVIRDGTPGGPVTRVVCGFLGCDLLPFNPVLESLPPLVVVDAGLGSSGGAIASIVDLAVAESRRPRPGSRSIVLRLSELLFVEVLRRCFETHPGSGWLEAANDPMAGRALVHLHRSPAAAWTLDTLAREVGVSRSRLAERFTELVGEPPMRYLARWRLQLAASKLIETSAKVAAIGHEVGYASEAAFSRAFKREVGLSPAAWRAERAR